MEGLVGKYGVLGLSFIWCCTILGWMGETWVRADEAPETPVIPVTIDESIEETGGEASPPQDIPNPISIEPLEVCWFDENPQENEDCVSENTVITKDTISQTELTVPSLWWANEQYGGKLLDNWLAYPDRGRVDLVVNRQRWTLLDYLQRYAFVNQMGTVVRTDGYNLRIFNRQEPERPIATYTCNFNITPPECEIEINSGARPNLEDDESGKRSRDEDGEEIEEEE